MTNDQIERADLPVLQFVPHNGERIETGPLQVGDADWPGTFIRGDRAMYYAMGLSTGIAHLKDIPDAHHAIPILRSLADKLKASRVGNHAPATLSTIPAPSADLIERVTALALMNCIRAEIGFPPIEWDASELSDEVRNLYLGRARAILTELRAAQGEQSK